MAHRHEPVNAPVHEHEVVEHGYPGAGMIVAAVAIVAAVIIGLAVLWAAPWDDDGANTVPVDPPITNDGGSNEQAPSQPDSGGEGGGGESQPDQPVQ